METKIIAAESAHFYDRARNPMNEFQGHLWDTEGKPVHDVFQGVNLSGGVEQREVASPYVPETKRALVSQAAPPSQNGRDAHER